MPIPVVCPSCGNNISAPDHVKGRTLRCYKCLNPFTVPNVTPSPAPVAPMAQLAPSFGAAPAAAPMPMPAPVPVQVDTGPDPFELNQQEPTWDAPAPVETPLEELPSTQDLPMEEIAADDGAMELSPADEIAAPEEPVEVDEEPAGPQKSRMVALLLCFLFGGLSVHRFYLGYKKSAILQILLIPLGIGLIWVFFDFLRLLFGKFKVDARGVPLR